MIYMYDVQVIKALSGFDASSICTKDEMTW